MAMSLPDRTLAEDVLSDVPAEKLNEKLSDDDLNEISKSLTHWRAVSPWLGLTEAEEEEVREGRDIRRQRIDALRKWRKRQNDRATYRSLIDVFHRAQRLDLVDITVSLLLTSQHLPSPKQSPLPHIKPLCSPLRSLPPSPRSPLVEYGEYLKRRYRRDIPIFSVQWPPMPIRKAFKLALIHPTKVQRGAISDDFVRMTVTGKVDDILHLKKPVKLVDIFKLEGDDQHIQEDDRKVILVEGAPGSGKSTLSSDICKRWGTGELFQEYDVIILVQLRDPEVQAATTLAHLLPAKNEAMAESIASQITECEGEKVLFILDGWDELPHHLQDKSLYRQLITFEKKSNLSLQGSAVVVTSRPISSGELRPLVSSRVEIVGFAPEELRQYFTECLSNDTREVEALLERIEDNPVVASSCYLPLNAAIIVHLFLSYDKKLPNTVHGIFSSLILCCLCRYQRERLGLKEEAANIESLDNLPENLDKPFKQLCSLAFLGVMEDRVTFSSTDLEALSINTDVSALGLIQAMPSMISQKVSMYYNFLHLQIQELLAAYHISSLSGSEQISRFQKLFNLPRFLAVFQFYAGITGFRSERKYLCKVAFLLPTSLIPTGIRDVITNMIRSNDIQLLLSVIKCLFEAYDPALCQFVSRQLNKNLDLGHTTLSPLDCLSVGYFLSCVCATTSGKFTVYLFNCSIDAHCCKFLMRGLSRCSTSNTTATSQLTLRLSLSFNHELCDTGASLIAEGLKTIHFIHILTLQKCGISDEGVEAIGQALLVNNTLKVLWLDSNYGITEKGHTVLTECLKTNRGLVVLYLPRHLKSAGVQETVNAARRESGALQIHIVYQ